MLMLPSSSPKIMRMKVPTCVITPGAVIEADGVGYLRYEDLAVQTGVRYGYRLGIMDGAVELFVGEAWAVAERQVFALEGIRPNPAAGSAMAHRSNRFAMFV